MEKKKSPSFIYIIQTCGVKIDTNSDGWHKCLTKMLKKIQGASYNVDAEGGMAYVSGKVNPRKLIRRLVKAGKEAELCWVRTGDEFTYGNGNGNGYYEDQRYYDPSSNYMGLTAGPNYYNMNDKDLGNFLDVAFTLVHYSPRLALLCRCRMHIWISILSDRDTTGRTRATHVFLLLMLSQLFVMAAEANTQDSDQSGALDLPVGLVQILVLRAGKESVFEQGPDRTTSNITWKFDETSILVIEKERNYCFLLYRNYGCVIWEGISSQAKFHLNFHLEDGSETLVSFVKRILDNNNLTGRIPSTIGNVQTLLTVRLDRNSLSGHVPSSLNNLSNMAELHLSNNKLTGPMPNLTGMDLLYYVVLRNNHLNGLLDIGTIYSDQLQLIDLENNLILYLTQSGGSNYTLILLGNPICDKTNMEKKYCIVSRSDSSYSTPPSNCAPVACSSSEVLSPNCKCAHPFKATLVVLFVSFSNLGNFSYYTALQASLMQSFHSYKLPVDSVSVSYPTWSSSYYLQLMLEVFPSGEDRFNETGASALASVLSNQTLPRPDYFGPYIVVFYYGKSGGSNKALVIGAAVGGSALLILVALVGVYAFQHKRKANEPWSRSIPLGRCPFITQKKQTWNSNISGPQLKGARLFSFEELMKYTNCFSEANDIGSGGYGKVIIKVFINCNEQKHNQHVYLGILPTGQMVAIKRAKRESMQGGIEFKAEVELLSRVHHKNLVSLVGFCLEQDEQMLVYEYAPNGNLRDSLSGKSGVWLDWMRRLKVALGAARGLAYLHEHANPSIIHRDIKPNNILLDKDLNAKVADFGLSKSMGIVGYLDPEYYMTQQLTEKSDVYSFGVTPIERGKYIVRVVQMAMDKTKDLYNLQKILDPAIGLGRELKGLENFVDLAMLCLEDLQAKRPRMGEVVKEIENIIQLAALNTSYISASTSGSSEDVGQCDSVKIYIRDIL
ncbi:Leucine-rich repeat protein kinase family protein, partial [Prunus dulcis]